MKLDRDEIAVGPFGMTEVQFYGVYVHAADMLHTEWKTIRNVQRAAVLVYAGSSVLADAWIERDSEEARQWLVDMVRVKLKDAP